MSQNTKDQDKMQQISSQWAEVIAQLFDRLTGKGASVTYNFDNLVIDMPKAQGPGGRDMGSRKMDYKRQDYDHWGSSSDF